MRFRSLAAGGGEGEHRGQVGHGPAAPAAACRGIVAALDVDARFHDGPAELKLPHGGAGQERVGLIGDLLGMTGEEADDEAGHGKVVRVAQQCRYQGGKRCPLLEPLVGDLLDRQQRAHARVGPHGRSAIPRPHVLIADEVPVSRVRDAQLDPRNASGSPRSPAAPTRELAA